MAWRMLHFSDVQMHPPHHQLLAFAGAYLDSAETLCQGLCSGERPANYAHGAVVMSLAFHSLELFFKGCILKLQPKEKFGGKSGHDLDVLSKRYFKLFPKQEFQFEVPFRHEIPAIVGGMTANKLAEFLAFVSKSNRRIPEDQRHRYPTGVDGKPWDGAFGFEPNSFLVTVRELQTAYARILPLLHADVKSSAS